jgi:glycopeptide antibiotics resistance protein
MGVQKKVNKRLPYFNLFQRITLTAVGICYTLGFVYVCFFARRRWGFLPSRHLNLQLFREKIQFWESRVFHTRPERIEFYKDFIGNIILFIPLPFILFYFFGVKTFSRLLLFSIASSVSVETVQYILNIGVADIDDVFLNTIGALMGILILFGFFRSTDRYDAALRAV